MRLVTCDMIYFYAITDRPELPLPAEPGLEDTSLFNLTYQDIGAVVSFLNTAKVPPTEDNLWRHEAIMEALMADRAVLPVRFGTMLAGDAAVQAVLAARYAEFVARLKHVCGRVELGLRVLWDLDEQESKGVEQRRGADSRLHPGASLPRDSGRSYLLARLEEERLEWAWHQRAEALAAEIHALLTRLAVESAKQVLLTPRLLLTAAYLVERVRMAAFQREVEALNAAYPALRFLCTGPWPPYSFVTAEVPMTDSEEERKNAHT